MSRRSTKNIPESSLSELREAIVDNLGKQVCTTADCEDLSASIYSRTGIIINYNTLRRFYKLLPNSKTQTSIATLNVLTNYCGYRDLDDFLDNKKSNTYITCTRTILKHIQQERINIKEVELYCQTKGANPGVYNFLSHMLLIAGTLNDYDFLSSFYKLPVIFNHDRHNKYYLHELATLYAIVTNRLSQEKLERIHQEIAKDEVARRFYIEQIVDIDNLNTSYGYLLDQYIQYETSNDAKVFYHSLQILKFFLYDNNDKLEEHYNILIQHDLKEIAHPILRSRIIASKIYYAFLKKQPVDDNITIIKAEIISLSSKKSNMLSLQLFLLFILQACYLTNNDQLLTKILKMTDNKILKISNYWTGNATNHISIFYAYHCMLNNEKKKAKEIIDKIDTTEFPLFEKNIQMKSYERLLHAYGSLSQI